jgi:hypothetical protein
VIRRLALLALMLFVGACTTDAPAGQEPPTTEPSVTPSRDESPEALGRYAQIACDLPRNQLQRVLNGYITGKSGEIQFVLRTPHFFGLYSHSGPWNYLQRVPVFFYGPGHVPAAGQIGRPVTVADMAPTMAGHLGFEFDTADGDPLDEAIAGSADPPKLILVVVWDAGGRNVLAAHQAAWAPVRSLIPEGAWFEHATVGSSPSVTPAVHATLGSGELPRRHGVLDLRIREGDQLVGPILNGPQYMLEPTLADEWDLANGNRPVVGLIASEPTLGMLGHGSYLEGADRDVALGQREGIWGLTPENQRYFEFRDYVNDIGGLDEAVRRLDTQDGIIDGAWLDHPLETPDDILHTPAYAEYQTDVIAEVIRREGFGQDDVPDLLFTNYKQIDKMGHRWSFPTPQMAAVVRSSAREFVALTRLLDQEVGRGEWVMALTADHGATPLASQTGAYAINQNALTDDINAELDTDGDAVPVVSSFRVTQLWINVAELQENGHSLGDIADFLMDYTALDNAADPAALSPDLQSERLFSAAFPGEVLDNLPCLDQPSG